MSPGLFKEVGFSIIYILFIKSSHDRYHNRPAATVPGWSASVKTEDEASPWQVETRPASSSGRWIWTQCLTNSGWWKETSYWRSDLFVVVVVLGDDDDDDDGGGDGDDDDNAYDGGCVWLHTIVEVFIAMMASCFLGHNIYKKNFFLNIISKLILI